MHFCYFFTTCFCFYLIHSCVVWITKENAILSITKKHCSCVISGFFKSETVWVSFYSLANNFQIASPELDLNAVTWVHIPFFCLELTLCNIIFSKLTISVKISMAFSKHFTASARTMTLKILTKHKRFFLSFLQFEISFN